jgi:hypothetical protein
MWTLGHCTLRSHRKSRPTMMAMILALGLVEALAEALAEARTEALATMTLEPVDLDPPTLLMGPLARDAAAAAGLLPAARAQQQAAARRHREARLYASSK